MSPKIPDLDDPRYLDEVGWFLYHDRFERDQFCGDSYAKERLAYSTALLGQVLEHFERSESWLHDKTVVNIGSGCTAELSAWPARAKIAVDPLVYVYQQLGMMIDDAEGMTPTVHLACGVEDIMLIDRVADLLMCRNALDHMHHPDLALAEMWRLLKSDGALYLSVDLGGLPTPDEPTVFSEASLMELVTARFEVVKVTHDEPHSAGRDESLRISARKKAGDEPRLDREAVLQNYLDRIGFHPEDVESPRS